MVSRLDGIVALRLVTLWARVLSQKTPIHMAFVPDPLRSAQNPLPILGVAGLLTVP